MTEKATSKAWVLPVLGLVVMLLTAALAFVVLRYPHKAEPVTQTKGTSAASERDKQIFRRDGKTEQIILLSQRGSTPFNVEIASTEVSRERGLSGRDGLAPNSGMLFVFAGPGYDCFWMKDMNFDIDMLWFDENQNLVHVQENASKSTYPSSFCPQTPASYVLEVPAGTVKQLGLQLGDRFTTP